MPTWGAPASGSSLSTSNASRPSQNSPTPDSQGQSPGRFRHSPYHNNSFRGRRGNADSNSYSSRGSSQSATHSQQMSTQDSISQSSEVSSPSFSPINPFHNQPKFSSDNPFASGASGTSVFSNDNPYTASSPVHNRPMPRPLLDLSPLVSSPRGGNRGSHHNRFSPHTPASSGNFGTPPHFQSPSPRYHTPSNRFQPRNNAMNNRFPMGNNNTHSPTHRFQSRNNRGFGSPQGGYQNRNGSFNNPGGSDDIQKYIHPSMLQDPWKDLPPTPMLQTY